MNKSVSKLKLYTILFLFGGSFYCLLELIWREKTHWSMAICGGICFLFLYILNDKLHGVSVLKLSFISCIFITAAELFFGFVLNIVFGLDVWDYSDVYLNFFGQICQFFSLVWFILSYFGLYLSSFIKKCLE